MSLPLCSSCGRTLNAAVSPNGEDPCVICLPTKRAAKAVGGVGPTSVTKEDGSQRTAEVAAAKEAERVEKITKAKKVTKKKAASKKKVTKKKAAKKK